MKVKNFLKGKGVIYGFMAGALVVLLLLAGLPACAPAAEEEVVYDEYVASLPEGCLPVPQDCFDQAMEEGQLNIYDWAEWWPEEIYTDFAEEYGLEIARDNYSDYDEVVAKFQLNPDTAYDMITGLAGRDLFRLQGVGVLQEINYDWVPNAREYIYDRFTEMEFDPGAKYGIFSGYSYITYGYNAEYVDDPRIPSLAVLLEPDEKYKGRITMIDDMFLTIGIALQYLGYPIDSDDEAELMEAKELLLAQKPYVMAYDWWPKRAILEGETWIAHLGIGDLWSVHSELGSMQAAATPPEGARMAQEIMAIPIGSPHPAVAHLWMDYIQRPQVNALLCNGIGYTPCNKAAAQYMDEDVREWIAVPESYLDKIQPVLKRGYSGKGLELRTQIWEELKG